MTVCLPRLFLLLRLMKSKGIKAVEAYTKHTSYVLGLGSIICDDIGDSVPYEMSRDPKTNGGQDTLYTRDRYICGVDGISLKSLHLLQLRHLTMTFLTVQIGALLTTALRLLLIRQSLLQELSQRDKRGLLNDNRGIRYNSFIY